MVSKKQLTIIFIILILLMSIGLWYFLINIRTVNVVIKNHGFWEKNNIHLYYPHTNETATEEISAENSSFLFIETMMDIFEWFSLSGVVCIDYLADYTVNEKNQTIEGGYAAALDRLNLSSINNTLKVVLGIKIHHQGFESGRGGWLLGYHTLPCNLSPIEIYEENRKIAKIIRIRVNEYFGVFVDGKLLNINTTITHSYAVGFSYPMAGLYTVFLIAPIAIFLLLVLKEILKKCR